MRTSVQTMAIGLTIITPDGSTNLNDKTSYGIQGSSRETVQTQYNQVKATSPVLAGEYLIHSTPQMVTESVGIWCYGSSVAQAMSRYLALKTLFENWTYQLVWTYPGYTETWNCNAVSGVAAQLGQGMLHNYMAGVTLQVPRFPTVLTA